MTKVPATTKHHTSNGVEKAKMFFRPRHIRFNFTPGQLELLSTLFEQDKYADVTGRSKIAHMLNIPELVISFYFYNKRLKEKLRQEELNRCEIIKRNYALLGQLWENNNPSEDSPICSTKEKRQNILSNIRCEPVPKYPDEVFQLFNFCNKNRHKLKLIIIPRQFMRINIKNHRAIEFYRQYHLYMAKKKAKEPSSVEMETFSETFPVVASSEYFEQQVNHMRGQTLGQANSAFRNEIISIGLDSSANIAVYERFENLSSEPIEHSRNNIPKQQVSQVCRNETALATQNLPINGVVNTSLAQSSTEQENSQIIRQNNSQENQVFRNKTASVITESSIDIATNSSAIKSFKPVHHQSNYVVNPGVNHVIRNETVIKSPTNFGNSQSSTTVSSYIIQQHSAHQIGQVHDINQNKRPKLASGSNRDMEKFKKSKEVELLTLFIKYCIIKHTESDQIIGKSVSVSPSQLSMTTKIPVPNIAKNVANNSNQPLIKNVTISSQSLEEQSCPLDLSNRRTMILEGQKSVPSGSRPSQTDRIQPSVIDLTSANQSLVNKNRHSLIAADQFPAPDRVNSLVSHDIKPSVLAQTQSNANQLLKPDPVLPFGHISNHAQPLVPDRIKPYAHIAPIIVHPYNYHGGRLLRSDQIQLDEYNDTRLNRSDHAHSSVPNRIKPSVNMKSNLVHPYNYNGSGLSRSDPIPLDKYDGNPLYICDQAQPSVSNHIKTYDNNGNQPSAPDTPQPAVITTDGILMHHDNQYYQNHIYFKNLSGGRLWQHRPTNAPVKPLHHKIGAMTLSKARAESPISTWNPTQRAKTQPRPLPHTRSVPKVETKQKPEEK